MRRKYKHEPEPERKPKKKRITIAVLMVICIGSLAHVSYYYNVFGVKDYLFFAQKNIETHIPKKPSVIEINTNNSKKIRENNFSSSSLFSDDKASIISIPFANIYLPIYEGEESTALLKGTFVLRNRTSLMAGSGNYVVAGHNFNNGEQGFSRLQKNTNSSSEYLKDGIAQTLGWLEGKEVYIADRQGVTLYIIQTQTVSDQSDTSYTQNTKENKLTLITCLYPETNYRIITKAKFKESYTWSNAPDNFIKQFSENKKFNQ